MTAPQPTQSPDFPTPAIYTDSTSLAPGHYGKPLLLDMIFLLLVKMITRLQQTAAAQANRLTFLSNWQAAYTNELNQIHSFVASNSDGTGINNASKGSDTAISTSDTDQSNARQDLNSTNSIYTQQMQGNRQIIADDAKTLQGNVNATSDAVQQQTDMATSILQQMSTILTSIFASAG